MRTRAGVFDVSHMGRLYISGPKATAFLDWVLTGSVQSLAVGRARYCMICNEDGGVIDDTIFYRLAEDRYLLIPNAGNRDAVVAWFQHWIDAKFPGECQIDDRTEATALIALQGPQAVGIMDGLCALDSGEPPSSLRPFAWAEGKLAGETIFMGRTGYTGAVEANAEAGGGAVGGDPPVVRDEAVERVLGGDPALHRVAAQRELALRRAGVVGLFPDGAAFGDADLGPHEVDAGHLLGDGVLHLDARIDLDEVEAPGVEIVQELHRARVEVVGRAGDGERVAGELIPLRRRKAGGRRALHDLLVAPLHRAVALEEVDGLAVQIRQNLDLQVAGATDEALEVDVVLAEGGVRLAPGREQGGLELVPVSTLRMPRPPPPQLALSMPGNPTPRASSSAAAGSAGRASVAGTVGTPARPAISRADTLSPSRRRVSGRGPMKAIRHRRRLRRTRAIRRGSRSPDGSRRSASHSRP